MKTPTSQKGPRMMSHWNIPNHQFDARTCAEVERTRTMENKKRPAMPRPKPKCARDLDGAYRMRNRLDGFQDGHVAYQDQQAQKGDAT